MGAVLAMNGRSRITRIPGAFVAALLVLAGCGSLIPGGQGGGDPRAGLDRAAVEREGGPLLFAQLPELGSAALLRPAGRNGDVVTWIAPDKVSVALDGGVLTGTRGLGHDLMSAETRETRRMLAGADMPARGYPLLHGHLDGEHRLRVTSYLCRETARRPETVTILGVAQQTTRVTESCTAPDIAFRNDYWLGPDGLMWKARQWAGPALGHLLTERLHR
jgi:hypothetical protein